MSSNPGLQLFNALIITNNSFSVTSWRKILLSQRLFRNAAYVDELFGIFFGQIWSKVCKVFVEIVSNITIWFIILWIRHGDHLSLMELVRFSPGKGKCWVVAWFDDRVKCIKGIVDHPSPVSLWYKVFEGLHVTLIYSSGVETSIIIIWLTITKRLSEIKYRMMVSYISH